jgi:hypothetical protein
LKGAAACGKESWRRCKKFVRKRREIFAIL